MLLQSRTSTPPDSLELSQSRFSISLLGVKKHLWDKDDPDEEFVAPTLLRKLELQKTRVNLFVPGDHHVASHNSTPNIYGQKGYESRLNPGIGYGSQEPHLDDLLYSHTPAKMALQVIGDRVFEDPEKII